MNEGLIIVGAKGNRIRDPNDFYKTPAGAVRSLIKRENIEGNILEPACGDGAISELVKNCGMVTSLDIVDRGYGQVQDYFDYIPPKPLDVVITNPPYKHALKFVRKALNDVKDGGKVCMLLKLVFLESQKRYEFFKENPPRRIYVFSRRLPVHIRGERIKNSGLVCYAWFVWEKGWKGKPELDWISEDDAYLIDGGGSNAAP